MNKEEVEDFISNLDEKLEDFDNYLNIGDEDVMVEVVLQEALEGNEYLGDIVHEEASYNADYTTNELFQVYADNWRRLLNYTKQAKRTCLVDHDSHKIEDWMKAGLYKYRLDLLYAVTGELEIDLD